MTAPQTFLYIPGDRPERLARYRERGADAVIADLEDAVLPEAKYFAREGVVRWLETVRDDGPQVWIRVNGDHRRDKDVQEVSTHPAVTGLLLPKVDHADQLRDAQALVGKRTVPLRWAPMIESAAGLLHIDEIASVPGVAQLHIGEMDLAADLNLTVTDDENELLYPRSLVVIASRAAGLLAPAGPVSARFDDPQEFERSTVRLRNLGFFGRDCIHPAQVAVANRVFAPSAEMAEWGKAVLAAAVRNKGAFRDRDGSMVDEAVLRRARDVVSRTALHPPGPGSGKQKI